MSDLKTRIQKGKSQWKMTRTTTTMMGRRWRKERRRTMLG